MGLERAGGRASRLLRARGSRARIVRVGALVVGLALITAAPALAAALTSSTTYDFAANNSSEWKTSNQAITISVEPSTSDATATIHYSLNGGVTFASETAPATGTAVFTINLTSEGQHQFEYYASELAGSTTTVEATHTPGWVNIDKTAPETTGAAGGLPLATTDDSGWRNAAQTVTFTPSDTVSGVASHGTTYRVDDGNLTIYENPFTISGQGSTKLTYKSADVAGNVEATQTGYVNIDTTMPVVSASTSPSSSNGWYKTDVEVTLTATDTPSGIDRLQYREQGSATWTTISGSAFTLTSADNGGIHTYEYRAVDRAENITLGGKIKANIDTVGPRTSAKKASGYRYVPVRIWYRSIDDLSTKIVKNVIKIKDSRGKTVKTKTVVLTKKSGTWYSFTWKATKRGTYKAYVYGRDLAGNKQSVRGTATIRIK
mgnify:FL=1